MKLFKNWFNSAYLYPLAAKSYTARYETMTHRLSAACHWHNLFWWWCMYNNVTWKLEVTHSLNMSKYEHCLHDHCQELRHCEWIHKVTWLDIHNQTIIKYYWLFVCYYNTSVLCTTMLVLCTTITSTLQCYASISGCYTASNCTTMLVLFTTMLVLYFVLLLPVTTVPVLGTTIWLFCTTVLDL